MDILEKLHRRNYWMIVKVKAKELKVPIVIPVPLFLVEDIVASVVMLYTMGRRVFPKLKEHAQMKFRSFPVDLDDCLELPVEIIRELRSLGKFTLVEVKEEGVHVSVKLY